MHESETSVEKKDSIDPKPKSRLEVFLILVPLVQKLLTLTVIVAIAAAFYTPISTRLVANVSRMELFGIELEFSQKPALDLLKEQAPNADFSRVFNSVNNRLRRMSELIVGAKVLWIDDMHPTQNIRERELLREMGLFVDMAKSEREAQELLDSVSLNILHSYDVIISDNTRGENRNAGQEFFAQLAKRPLIPKLILYTGEVNKNASTPNYVFGATDRFDELLHLIMDALERSDESDSSDLSPSSA